MKEYEIVCTYLNGCGGERYPQTTFEEAELSDPADYVRQKHGRLFPHFVREDHPEGRVVYRYSQGVTYIYEFNEL